MAEKISSHLTLTFLFSGFFVACWITSSRRDVEIHQRRGIVLRLTLDLPHEVCTRRWKRPGLSPSTLKYFLVMKSRGINILFFFHVSDTQSQGFPLPSFLAHFKRILDNLGGDTETVGCMNDMGSTVKKCYQLSFLSPPKKIR